MIERRTVGRRVLFAAGTVLAAVVAVGCVAAPGASGGPDGTTGPTASPTASPPATPTPTPVPPSPSPTGSSSTPPSASPATSPSTAACGVSTWAKGSKDLVLRIWVAGGFVPVGTDLTNSPVISVYGDGTVVSPGAQIMIYPGPLLPALQVQKLTEAGMRKLLDAAEQAGLTLPDAHYDSYGIADAPTTFFTFTADGCTHRISAYALTESISTDNLDKKTIAAREALLKFRDALGNLETLVGAANVADGGLLKATAYRIVSREDAGGTGALGSPAAAVKWPLKTPLATFGDPLTPDITDTRCGTVTGADATVLTPLFEAANAETRFSSGGKTYVLRVRQLLADEAGCKDDIGS
jgi:hypothetical protein